MLESYSDEMVRLACYVAGFSMMFGAIFGAGIVMVANAYRKGNR